MIKKFFLIFLTALLLLIIHNAQAFYIPFFFDCIKKDDLSCTLASDPTHCKYPKKIGLMVTLFKKKLLIQNRLLLYGPTGTGKTMLATFMLQDMGCKEIIVIDCPSLVSYEAGGASRNIKRFFNDIEQKYQKTQAPVGVIIEEADAIAHKITTENQNFNEQRTSGLQTLWLKLDEYRDKKYVFFIITTNRRENIEPAFLNRIGTQIEIPVPHDAKRKDFIAAYAKIYFGQYNKENNSEIFSEAYLKKLVKKNKKFTIALY